MVARTSGRLIFGHIYTREQLRKEFKISDATLNNGIFRPKGTDSVWLFVTEEKTSDRVQYSDHLAGDVLLMQGQTAGRTDHLIVDQVTNGLELLVFYRTKKYAYDGAGFRYEGPFGFVRSFGRRPTSFVLLRDRARPFTYGTKPSWRWTLEAVHQLGRRATSSEIVEYIADRVPGFNIANVDPDLRMLSVNDYGRSNWSQNQTSRSTDGWNVYDALFKRKRETGGFTYEPYDPEAHGVWELVADVSGVLRPFLKSTSTDAEMARSQDEIQQSKGFDATNEDDGRMKVAASIVRRQGQPKFRRDLLTAYDERCAVTGCSVVEILEGAHIKPYRGDHTNHVTNGLLLRSDIHTLFDLRLLRIAPSNWAIEIAQRARSTYEHYHGQVLRLPMHSSSHPDLIAIQQHYDSCAPQFSD